MSIESCANVCVVLDFMVEYNTSLISKRKNNAKSDTYAIL